MTATATATDLRVRAERRLATVCARLAKADSARSELVAARTAAVMVLVDLGVEQRDIAVVAGLSPDRVKQLVRAGREAREMETPDGRRNGHRVD